MLQRNELLKRIFCCRINLESSYTSAAIILVEVPSGFTAAMMVCLAMTIQENTLEDSTIELENSHRLHATVISIMSLVCWLHEAKVSIMLKPKIDKSIIFFRCFLNM